MNQAAADERQTAFLLPAPLSLEVRDHASWIRRPRHTTRAGGCRCRLGRPRVRCSAEEDPRDDEVSGVAERRPDAWVPFLRIWLQSKDSNSDLNGASEPVRSKAHETPQEDIELVGSHTNNSEPQENTVPEENQRTPFRWPWQKNSKAGRNAIGGDSETTGKRVVQQIPRVKKVSHSDSKPGGSLANITGSTKPVTRSEGEQVSWQDRLDKIVNVIAPNINRKEPETTATQNETKGRPSGNGMHSDANDSESSTPPRASSVSELYSPPVDAAEDTGKSVLSGTEEKKPTWPKMPWNRDREELKPSSSPEKQVTIVSEERSRTRPRISRISVVKKGSERAAKESSSPENISTPDREKDPEMTVLDVVDFTDSRETSKEDTETVPGEDQQTDGEKEPSAQLPSVSASQLRIIPMDIVSIPQRDVAAIRLIFGSETFFATETLSPPGGLIFRGNLRGEPKATLAKLEERLAARLGDKYTLCLAEGEEDLRPVVVVVPTARDRRPATPRQRILALVIALFTITTCLTRGLYAAVYKPIIQAFYPLTGASPFEEVFAAPSGVALITSAAIGFVIFMSQIVQRIVASRHGTRIALPYFIPSVQLGSFGAVVQLASPTPSRAALFDIALAGAATLVVLSMSFLLIGLRLSTIFPTVVPVPMSTVSSSVVIGFLTQHIPQGQILVDYGRSLIGLHPLAVIGANCLTIAALNLLPIRQLDGGRIISALYGRRTAVVTSRVTVLFLLLASTKNPYFVVFLAAVTFGPWSLDRPAKNELTEPNGFRTVVGYLFMLLMIGVLLPFPASRFFGTL